MSETSILSWQSKRCPCKGTCDSPVGGANKKWSGVWWDHCGNEVKAGSDPTMECKPCRNGNWAARFALKGGQKNDPSGQKDVEDVTNINDEMTKAFAELKEMMKAIVESVTERKAEI